MNRLRIFTLSTIVVLVLAMLPGGIGAQQGTLKQQLVGTWTLVSQENTASIGTKTQISNPRGILFFDAGVNTLR
jgi:hypothetical protein